MVIPCDGWPCLASVEMYSKWVDYVCGRGEAPCAAAHPNRYSIFSRSGEEVLSIPVEGGRAALKRHRGGDRLPVSLHGLWWRTHCGALSAAYGKEPYFPHYFPRLEEILISPSAGSGITLDELSATLHGFVVNALFSGGRLESLERLREGDPGRLEAIRREYETRARRSLSIVDSLFRFGPAALFLF